MILLIADVRRTKKMSQSELASMTGINQRMISRFETGQSIPRVDQLVEMMKALGCEWGDLVEV